MTKLRIRTSLKRVAHACSERGMRLHRLMPVVSVIMVAHRDTPYLRPAIQSVLTQTWRDLELVLVDNGIGLTPVDLGEFGRDERLRLVTYPENRGISAGLNGAVQAARGEFVALLDSDDIALPERIARQIEVLRARPELGMLFMAARTIDGEGQQTGREFTLLSERDHRLFNGYDMPAITPTFMCRRETLNRFPYREVFNAAADYDVLTRLSDVMSTTALPEEGIAYRRHAMQATQQLRIGQILSANIIRLITARRRDGREEGFEEIITELGGWMSSPPSLAVQYSYFTRRSLREKFPLLAVYFARKLLSVERGPHRIVEAGRVLVTASLRHPRQIIVLWRMFFTGPLKTFGLRPVS